MQVCLLPLHACLLEQLRGKYGDDWERISRMSIIEEAYGEKHVRMAYLGVVCSHTVNGVAAIHSDIIKNTIFKDFYAVSVPLGVRAGIWLFRWFRRYVCLPEMTDVCYDDSVDSRTRLALLTLRFHGCAPVVF